MDTKYTVMFTGELCSGFNFDEVLANFITLTKMEAEKAKKFLSSAKPVLIRKDVDRETAEKYRSGLTKAGLQIQLLGPGSQSTEKNVFQNPQAVPEESSPGSITQATSMSQVASNQASAASLADNPYAAPKADLQVEKKEMPGDWLDQPQKVPGSHGWHWVKDATGLFLAAPWKWLGMCFVAALITIPLSLIPFVGQLFNIFLGLLLGGGMLMGAHDLAEGGDLTFSYLFKGFKHNRNQLLMIGVIYLAFFFLLGIGAVLVLGAGSLTMFGIGGDDPAAVAMAMQNNMGLFLVFILVCVALSIPFMMAYWFTTPLVALSDRKAWLSYKLSFKGCLKNWLAFLVYSLVFLVIGVFIMIGFSIVSSLVGIFLAGDNTMLFAFVPIIIMLLIGLPLFIIGGLSVYTSFRDIFYREA